jgi:hypothetical protein
MMGCPIAVAVAVAIAAVQQAAVADVDALHDPVLRRREVAPPAGAHHHPPQVRVSLHMDRLIEANRTVRVGVLRSLRTRLRLQPWGP